MPDDLKGFPDQKAKELFEKVEQIRSDRNKALGQLYVDRAACFSSARGEVELLGIWFKALTVANYSDLSLCNNSIIFGFEPSRGDALAVLYSMRPDNYEADNPEKFASRFSLRPSKMLIAEVENYITGLINESPRRGGNATQEPFASWGAFIVDALCSRCGWGFETVLNLPLHTAFQLMRAANAARDPDYIAPPALQNMKSARLKAENEYNKYILNLKKEGSQNGG